MVGLAEQDRVNLGQVLLCSAVLRRIPHRPKTATVERKTTGELKNPHKSTPTQKLPGGKKGGNAKIPTGTKWRPAPLPRHEKTSQPRLQSAPEPQKGERSPRRLRRTSRVRQQGAEDCRRAKRQGKARRLPGSLTPHKGAAAYGGSQTSLSYPDRDSEHSITPPTTSTVEAAEEAISQQGQVPGSRESGGEESETELQEAPGQTQTAAKLIAKGLMKALRQQAPPAAFAQNATGNKSRKSFRLSKGNRSSALASRTLNYNFTS
uniref:Uncharacterized protein n=1 Tax=Sphaerodactylus townsendi TaxID=933632 RepID=A0ACB8FG77_9SAUR